MLDISCASKKKEFQNAMPKEVFFFSFQVLQVCGELGSGITFGHKIKGPGGGLDICMGALYSEGR